MAWRLGRALSGLQGPASPLCRRHVLCVRCAVQQEVLCASVIGWLLGKLSKNTSQGDSAQELSGILMLGHTRLFLLFSAHLQAQELEEPLQHPTNT